MPQHDRDDERPGGVVAAVRAAVGAELREDMRELREDTGRLERQVDRLDVRVDHLDKVSGAAREAIGKLQGEVSLIGVSYQRMAEFTAQTAQVDLEVRKQSALAEIRERGEKTRERRRLVRAFVFKGLAIAMGLWGIASAALAARC